MYNAAAINQRDQGLDLALGWFFFSRLWIGFSGQCNAEIFLFFSNHIKGVYTAGGRGGGLVHKMYLKCTLNVKCCNN